jgi:hypothetical protein
MNFMNKRFTAKEVSLARKMHETLRPEMEKLNPDWKYETNFDDLTDSTRCGWLVIARWHLEQINKLK